ncbi:glycosyltransferase family protein [Nocardiopsis coralliicola]
MAHLFHNTFPGAMQVCRRWRPDLAVFNTEWVREHYRRHRMITPGTETLVVHPPIDGARHRTRPGTHVTLVNLNRDKGGEIFYRLAERMPDVAFMGVVGGHGEQVIRTDLANVRIQPHTANARRDIWARTLILLMPSVYESYGMVAVEAAHSGIPTIANPTPRPAGGARRRRHLGAPRRHRRVGVRDPPPAGARGVAPGRETGPRAGRRTQPRGGAGRMGGRDRAAVIIPWRGGCPHREAALGWTAGRWNSAGYEVVLGAMAGEWCKGAAVADALPALDADLLIIADADCWSDGIGAAVNAVRSGAPWSMPHGPVRRLTHAATLDVLGGAEPDPGMDLVQRPYAGWPGGGIVVVPRSLYVEAPFDPRFMGWSGEDESAAHAWATLAGPPWRGAAPLWHLWHPPQPRMSRRWGSPEARSLAGRYQAAAGRPDAMLGLIGEARIPA